ncbi:MAG: PilN domain-containing protein [Deltaproteobacteria bacterium]|nr:PilN domain-containing protein [Deltaproteobacteria bacterium]
MIQHVNFLESQVVLLSYRRMLQLAAGLAGFMVLLYGMAMLQSLYLERKTGRLTAEVNQLKLRQEKLFTEAVTEQSLGGTQLVRQSFVRMPVWSRVLQQLVRLMPDGVWLTSLKSYEKSSLSSGRSLLLSGEAKEARDISRFLRELDLTSYFVNPILTDSKQEMRGSGRVYTFTIDLGISFQRQGTRAPGGP